MNYEFEQTDFSRAVLTGLFAGIVATCLSLGFDIIYRMYTDFALSELINVSSIIFITNLLLLIFGILYFSMKKSFRYGDVVCILIYIALTVFCIYKSELVVRSANLHDTIAFRGLLAGILLIIGLCSFVVLPALYKNKWFNTHVV
ncbi:MAG: hypothetical protein ABI480_15785 [Chitinophagaceae bacterium]